MKRLKVLQVITRFVHGGAQVQCLELAARLPADRFQVDLLTGPPDRNEGDLRALAAERGVVPCILPELVRPVRPWTDLLAVRAITRIVREGGYDLIHTHTSKAGVVGRVGAHRAGLQALVHSPHGLIYDPEGQIPGVSGRPWASRLFFRAEKRVNRYTRRIAALSDREARSMVDLGLASAAQVVTVPNGIQPELYRVDRAAGLELRAELGLPAGVPLAGAVGRLSPEKGQRVLVGAWSRVQAAVPGAALLLAGAGPDEDALRRDIAALGLGGSVRLLGLRTDLPRVLAALDVFVLPSLYEGFGIVAAEAMAAGLPVAAFDSGGVAEVVGEGGILVTRGDAAALASAVAGLLTDRDRARTLGAAGRARAEARFDIRAVVARWADLYEEVVRETRGVGE